MTAKRVLVVDDFQIAGDAMCRLLATMGYVVESCSQASECINQATRFKPDVVLLDIAMPNIDGYTLAQQLRRVEQSCKIIGLSGFTDAETRQRCQDAGFDGFLAKPASGDQVQAAID